MATVELYSGDEIPVGSAVLAYAAPSCSVGSCRTPKESQNTAKRPMTIMGKKFPMIHSNTMAKTSKTGPTKKKIPLCEFVRHGWRRERASEPERCATAWWKVVTYTTGPKPAAPPHPIRTMANVKVEITKLFAWASAYFIQSMQLKRCSPDKSQRGWVREPLVVVADVRHLGRQVELCSFACELPLLVLIGLGRVNMDWNRTFSKSSGDIVTAVADLCRPLSSS